LRDRERLVIYYLPVLSGVNISPSARCPRYRAWYPLTQGLVPIWYKIVIPENGIDAPTRGRSESD